MSRIEEALRRSHAREIAAGESRVPAADSFKSPWDFSGTTLVPGEAVRGTTDSTSQPAPVALSQLPETGLESGGMISGFNSR